MKQNLMKKLALGLAAACALTGVLTGCGGTGAGGSGNAELSKDFTWLIDTTPDTYYYNDYEENAVVKYLLSKEWTADGSTSKINIEFDEPPADGATDHFNTMLSTGEYADVMGMVNASDTPASLYEQGVVIDLTDYIAKYMPNYSKWLADNPIYAQQMTSRVNGEDKMLMIYRVDDAIGIPWECFMYRRDWIVEYGKNPETGAAFTGGWNADKTEWTDDVVFPGGETYPKYISDWEWMFEIFAEAIEDQGFEDGYPMQMQYTGYYAEGDLASSFGGGRIGTYVTKDGKTAFGGDTDSARAYMECLNHWYEEGWLDQKFEERSADTMFFMIDTPAVFTGHVGMWIGVTNQLENMLAAGDNVDPSMADICVKGAPQPINDLYGTDACKNVIPDTFFQNTIYSSGVVLTDKAAKKDIGKLLTMIDYLYTREGSLLFTMGLNKEQQAEVKDPLYTEYGLDDGAYYLEERDGEEWAVNAKPVQTTDGLLDAVAGMRLVGMGAQHNTDIGLGAGNLESMQLSTMYQATGNLSVAYTGLLSSEVATEVSAVNTSVNTYLATQIPEFITGRLDIEDDAAWQKYVDGLEELGAHRESEEINKALDAGK